MGPVGGSARIQTREVVGVDDMMVWVSLARFDLVECRFKRSRFRLPVFIWGEDLACSSKLCRTDVVEDDDDLPDLHVPD